MFPVIALHMLTKMQECLGDSILSLTCTYMTEEGPKVEMFVSMDSGKRIDSDYRRT